MCDTETGHTAVFYSLINGRLPQLIINQSQNPNLCVSFLFDSLPLYWTFLKSSQDSNLCKNLPLALRICTMLTAVLVIKIELVINSWFIVYSTKQYWGIVTVILWQLTLCTAKQDKWLNGGMFPDFVLEISFKECPSFTSKPLLT